MMMRVKEILGLMVRSTDGEVGKVEDLLFDSEDWAVRYVVVDTWNWLPNRTLIIPPALLKGPKSKTRRFDVPLAKREISSGAIRKTGEMPSRQTEASVFEHFNLSPYWAVRVPGGASMLADQLAEDRQAGGEPPTALRSFTGTAGFEVLASNGPIGRLSDLIVDEETWRIVEVLVDTTDWLGEGLAVLRARWFGGVDGANRMVKLERTREQVENDRGYRPHRSTPGAM